MPPGMVPPKTSAPKPKKAWVPPANWKAKTQALWLKNHPQPLFPSTNVTAKERAGVMNDSRSAVTKSYAASPMPSQQTYLQPFADASARQGAAGQNYVSYLDSAAQNAQNLSGAFNAALTGGITAGQANVATQGGSGEAGAIPTAGASLIPAAAVGSSFANYFNAEKPYVGAAVNEAQGAINKSALSAGADYQQAAAQRRSEIQDAIQKLYTSGLDTLQSSKIDANKAAVTEYLAMGKTAYQRAQAAAAADRNAETNRHNTQSETTAAARASNTAAYQQASLDLQRQKAKTSTGVDTSAALKTLLVPTTSTAPGTKGVGPQGQDGADYEIVETHYDKYGDVIPDAEVKTKPYIAYGEKVPKARTWTNPDGTKVKRTVTRTGLHKPKASTATTGRKATPASWDKAVQQLKAKYPGKITTTWLKANFPPRPAGS